MQVNGVNNDHCVSEYDANNVHHSLAVPLMWLTEKPDLIVKIQTMIRAAAMLVMFSQCFDEFIIVKSVGLTLKHWFEPLDTVYLGLFMPFSLVFIFEDQWPGQHCIRSPICLCFQPVYESVNFTTDYYYYCIPARYLNHPEVLCLECCCVWV